MAQVRFKVEGENKMHCAGCEQRVDNALHRLEGVGEVEATFQTQEVTVTVDESKVSTEQVRERLERLGYDVARQGEPV